MSCFMKVARRFRLEASCAAAKFSVPCLSTMAKPWRQARSSKCMRAIVTCAREGSRGQVRFAIATWSARSFEVLDELQGGDHEAAWPEGLKVELRHHPNQIPDFGRYVDRLRHVTLAGGLPQSRRPAPPSGLTTGGCRGPPTPRRSEWWKGSACARCLHRCGKVRVHAAERADADAGCAKHAAGHAVGQAF